MKPIFIICFLSLAVVAAEDQKDVELLFHMGNSRFTAKFFSEVAKINPDRSFVISPYSVMTPLAQLSIAARENTREQLWQAIGITTDEAVKLAFSHANTKVNSIKGVTLKTVSKIYLALNYDVFKDFGATTWETFGAAAQNIDFEKNEQAANEINTWVEQNTNNRIKNLVSPDSLGQDTRALLVNAIYFKGSWETQFDKTLTRERDFHINKAETKKVDMMHRRGNYKYTESAVLKSQIIEIPYKGDETSLVVVLPRDIEGIKEVQEVLKDSTVLDNALNDLRTQEVDLSLPTFKIETTTDLKDILRKMNVTEIFDPHVARLDYLIRVKGNMYISSAVQKAFIEVNEEGAEAAASNVFAAVSRSLSARYQRISFTADHPFIFYLCEGNNILFNGVFNS
ncbi:antichymotrypsin-2-like isoform X2 [Maniola hyperantus]|uniref:antichymotrypsin-2-like isoform X2 n=2 Tax=Aphantopus hyperantus TaxID=2795564 RepID=UPI0021386C91